MLKYRVGGDVQLLFNKAQSSYTEQGIREIQALNGFARECLRHKIENGQFQWSHN
jgi:hypothetical protein